MNRCSVYEINVLIINFRTVKSKEIGNLSSRNRERLGFMQQHVTNMSVYDRNQEQRKTNWERERERELSAKQNNNKKYYK